MLRYLWQIHSWGILRVRSPLCPWLLPSLCIYEYLTFTFSLLVWPSDSYCFPTQTPPSARCFAPTSLHLLSLCWTSLLVVTSENHSWLNHVLTGHSWRDQDPMILFKWFCGDLKPPIRPCLLSRHTQWPNYSIWFLLTQSWAHSRSILLVSVKLLNPRLLLSLSAYRWKSPVHLSSHLRLWNSPWTSMPLPTLLHSLFLHLPPWKPCVSASTHIISSY